MSLPRGVQLTDYPRLHGVLKKNPEANAEFQKLLNEVEPGMKELQARVNVLNEIVAKDTLELARLRAVLDALGPALEPLLAANEQASEIVLSGEVASSILELYHGLVSDRMEASLSMRKKP